MKGTVLVFEGTDGSGKQTQSQKCFEALVAKGVSVRMMSFPQYENPSSALVKKYLDGEFGENAKDVDAYKASSFYAIDRFVAFDEDLRRFLHEGGVLILDRYTTSSLLHQGGKIRDVGEREAFFDWVESLEYETYQLPRPKKVFYLMVPPWKNMSLMENRQHRFENSTKKDIHERDFDHLAEAFENGMYLVESRGWELVHCLDEEKHMRSIEDIHEEVMRHVWTLLKA